MVPRVLVLGDHFGYAGGVVHGVTTYFLNVLPRIAAQGTYVRCCFLRDEHPVAAQLAKTGITVDFLSAGKWNPLLTRRICRIVRDARINVIHTLGIKAALMGRLVAAATDSGLIIHSHDMIIPSWPVPLLNRLLRWRRERGLGVSVAVADCMPRAYGVVGGSVGVLTNGVDLERVRAWAPSELPAHIPAGVPVIGWVGRFHQVKGPQRMIRMMSAVVRRVPDAHLLMVGDGPEWQLCRQLVEQLGLGKRVTLVGQRQDVPGLLKRMSMMCNTSYSEGHSLAVLEAAVAALPVVAFSVGGMAEVVVDGVTGFLVADGDEAGFVDAVCRVLGNEELRSRMADSAEQHAAEFSLDRHIELLLAEYQQAAGAAPGKAA